MRKHTSGEAVYHFLPEPPNATSCMVPEIAVRKGGWWWMRKCERQRDSEVAMKKMLMKWLKVLMAKGNLKAIHQVMQRFKITHVCEKTQTTRGTGTGGARV